MFLTGRLRRKPKVDVVIARSNRAVLWRLANGELSCQCPYACPAASEPCEFDSVARSKFGWK